MAAPSAIQGWHARIMFRASAEHLLRAERAPLPATAMEETTTYAASQAGQEEEATAADFPAVEAARRIFSGGGNNGGGFSSGGGNNGGGFSSGGGATAADFPAVEQQRRRISSGGGNNGGGFSSGGGNNGGGAMGAGGQRRWRRQQQRRRFSVVADSPVVVAMGQRAAEVAAVRRKLQRPGSWQTVSLKQPWNAKIPKVIQPLTLGAVSGQIPMFVAWKGRLL